MYPTLTRRLCVLLMTTLCSSMVFATEPAKVPKVGDGEDFIVNSGPPTPRVGNVFVSSKKKDELLLRTNVWGAVNFPGVHYVPIGTDLINALSIAGGPAENADTENVYLSSTNEAKGTIVRKISIANALGGSRESNPILNPGDVILIKKNETRENVSLWLSVGTFTLSVIALSLAVANK